MYSRYLHNSKRSLLGLTLLLKEPETEVRLAAAEAAAHLHGY